MSAPSADKKTSTTIFQRTVRNYMEIFFNQKTTIVSGEKEESAAYHLHKNEPSLMQREINVRFFFVA